MTAQVRNCISARSSHPSGTTVPAQGEEVETQPSPSKSQPDDEPQLDLTWDIWELHLDQLSEALRALHMEIAKKEGPHLPWGHPRVV